MNSIAVRLEPQNCGSRGDALGEPDKTSGLTSHMCTRKKMNGLISSCVVLCYVRNHRIVSEAVK